MKNFRRYINTNLCSIFMKLVLIFTLSMVVTGTT